MNAVIYARYSSHSQQEQSIEGQLRDCYAYSEREGLAVVGEYIDRHISGTTDERPEFQRMIKDSNKHQFDMVIVWKLDRFARNRYDSAVYKNKLKKNSVRVVSATETISDEPEGIILESMLEGIAEYYSANLSKHVKRGLRESVLAGTWTGGRPPVGFKVVDKKLKVDEDTAPLIRYIFDQYAKGTPKSEIMSALNEKGYRNRNGKPLRLSSFQTAMKNPMYIGKWIYGGMEVQGECPRIIDDDTFRRVQERLAAVARAPAENKAKVDYLLRGKAFCGYCGSRLVGECGRSKTGAVHNYYSCAEKKKNHTCRKKAEKKGFLEWYVCEQTCLYVLDESRIDFIADTVLKAYEKEFDSGRVKELEAQAARLDREANTAVDTLVKTESKAVKDRLQKKLEELELQKADIELDLSRLRIAAGVKYTKEQVLNWLREYCDGDPTDEAFQRRIIDCFVNSVYVYDDKMVVFYNLKDSKQVSYIDAINAVDEMDEDTDLSGETDSGSKVRISNSTPRQKACKP